MITRDQARSIAEGEVRAKGFGTGVRGVYLVQELPTRRPNLYLGPPLDRCWIAYVDRSGLTVGSSSIVLIDRETGEVLYSGSANDEG